MISIYALPKSELLDLFPHLQSARDEEEYHIMLKRYAERWDKIGQAVELLYDTVNTSSLSETGTMFIRHMIMQHRTLQQSMFRVLMMYLEYIASDKYDTDGRNQHTKDTAQKLLAGFDWNGLKPSQCLPLI